MGPKRLHGGSSGGGSSGIDPLLVAGAMQLAGILAYCGVVALVFWLLT